MIFLPTIYELKFEISFSGLPVLSLLLYFIASLLRPLEVLVHADRFLFSLNEPRRLPPRGCLPVVLPLAFWNPGPTAGSDTTPARRYRVHKSASRPPVFRVRRRCLLVANRPAPAYRAFFSKLPPEVFHTALFSAVSRRPATNRRPHAAKSQT